MLGCVNSPQAARGSQEAGFTQPSIHLLFHVCRCAANMEGPLLVQRTSRDVRRKPAANSNLILLSSFFVRSCHCKLILQMDSRCWREGRWTRASPTNGPPSLPYLYVLLPSTICYWQSIPSWKLWAKLIFFLNSKVTSRRSTQERWAFNCWGGEGGGLIADKLDVASNGSLYFQGCSSFPSSLSLSLSLSLDQNRSNLDVVIFGARRSER